MNALLKFPSASEPESRKTELVFNFRQRPVLIKFGPDEAKKLLGTSQKVQSGLDTLIAFIDSHREDAAMAGIETISVELGQERAALGYVQDALEEAVGKDGGVELSDQAVGLLRRMEGLLAEASKNISRFTSKSMGELLSSAPSSFPPSASPDLLVPAVFFGLIAIAPIIAFTPRE